MTSHSFRCGAGTRAKRRDSEDAAVLAASGHLTGRDRYLVRMVGEHRVLTTDQLCALGFGNVITARHRLTMLVRIGALRPFRPRRDVGSAPWHYLLGPVGAALLGAEDRDERKWAPQVRADRQLALERSQRLAHMVGANWFFVSLARHARSGGGELRRWEAERPTAEYGGRCWRTGRTRTGWGSGPKAAATSCSCWSTTPAASTCPAWPATPRETVALFGLGPANGRGM